MVLRSISFHVASELQTYWTQNYGFSTISFMFYFTLQRYKTTLAMVSPLHFKHIGRQTYRWLLYHFAHTSITSSWTKTNKRRRTKWMIFVSQELRRITGSGDKTTQYENPIKQGQRGSNRATFGPRWGQRIVWWFGACNARPVSITIEARLDGATALECVTLTVLV